MNIPDAIASIAILLVFILFCLLWIGGILSDLRRKLQDMHSDFSRWRDRGGVDWGAVHRNWTSDAANPED
jgi:hypothetical protein